MRHSLTTVLDTKLERFHGGFFELKMLEMFTRAFFIKNHYWNLKLSIAALSSIVYEKMKKESLRRCEPPKNDKNSSHSKRNNKDIEKGE